MGIGSNQRKHGSESCTTSEKLGAEAAEKFESNKCCRDGLWADLCMQGPLYYEQALFLIILGASLISCSECYRTVIFEHRLVSMRCR